MQYGDIDEKTPMGSGEQSSNEFNNRNMHLRAL
jgi:hypothetical protein